MPSALVAYLHYLAMISIAVVLVLELLYCKPGLSDASARVLARMDGGLGAAAVIALVTGVARVVWFGKGAAFYLHNPVFHIKLALFLAVGLLSIPPTLQFLRWVRGLKGGAKNVAEPYQIARVRRYIHAELVIFVFIPLMAALMARGIGLQTASETSHNGEGGRRPRGLGDIVLRRRARGRASLRSHGRRQAGAAQHSCLFRGQGAAISDR